MDNFELMLVKISGANPYCVTITGDLPAVLQTGGKMISKMTRVNFSNRIFLTLSFIN